MARTGAIDLTEFVVEHVPHVYEELSSLAYDLE